MADGLNRALLLGNLGQDPELRTTQGGNVVLNMRLAVSESYLDRNKVRQERTEWCNVVVWGRRAEALSKFLSKGSRLFVEGGLRTSKFQDRDGNDRYKTEVVASNIVLAGGNGGGARGGGRRQDDDGAPDGGPGGYDDDYRGGGGDSGIPF